MTKYKIESGFWARSRPRWLADTAGLEQAQGAFLKAEAAFCKAPALDALERVEAAMARALKARMGTLADCKRAKPLGKSKNDERLDCLKLLKTGQSVETDRMKRLRRLLDDAIKARCGEARLARIVKLLKIGITTTGNQIASGRTGDPAPGLIESLRRAFADAEKITRTLERMRPKLSKACPTATAHVVKLRKDLQRLGPSMAKFESQVAELAGQGAG